MTLFFFPFLKNGCLLSCIDSLTPFFFLGLFFAELVLLGFISLLLTVLQQPISGIFISKTVGSTCHPCELVKGQTEKNYQNGTGRKLLQFLESGFGERRRLATKGYDKCTEKVIKALSFLCFFILFWFQQMVFTHTDARKCISTILYLFICRFCGGRVEICVCVLCVK